MNTDDLNDYTGFNNHVSVSKHHTAVMEELYHHLNLDALIKQRPDLTRVALNKVVANLIVSRMCGRPLQFSKRAVHYKASKRYAVEWKGYKRIMTIYDALLDHDFIAVAKGNYDSKRKRGVMTKMWIAPPFYPWIDGLSIELDEELGDVIIIRKKDSKANEDYKDNDTINKMRERVLMYNQALRSSKILFYQFRIPNFKADKEAVKIVREMTVEKKIEDRSIDKKRVISPDTGRMFEIHYKHLKRVFNRSSWELGGRFYGSVHMNIPSMFRETITIDDEPTVELDYSGLHIRMLYHNLGIPFDGECYVFSKQDKAHEAQRNLIKTMCLVAINVKRGRYGAVKATKKKLFKEFDKGKISIIPTDSQIYEAFDNFIEYHKPIADFIAKDKGIELQYQDSIIMDNILYRMIIENGIVSLPVHDSVICQAQHEQLLRQVMMEEYKKVMKFYPIID